MPTTNDNDLATELLDEIDAQASGTKDSERQKIKRMAQLAKKLLSGSATDDDRQQANDELHPSRQR